ncbi:MAG: 16S rRNA (adenine(1518)-N(6)/adenine(1519)-N(6))-dimethyltransferase RsmA [Firmicutes bacterium]|nr:16S rRNA (adenine(1518)-N(6)/adenine(1519)-N(6))-dimethyltransferase RsmA [Bacillota bacterium]
MTEDASADGLVLDRARLRALLERHGLGARQSFGQHYLVDGGAVRRIVEAVAADERSTVFEIGPGPGVLTAPLAARAGRVVAVELDRSFEPLLRERLAAFPHVRLLWQDALAVDWPALVAAEASGPAKLAANLPYNVAGPLLARLYAAGGTFERLVVMVQKEVAERMAAPPGSRVYGFFSVLTQLHAKVERLFTLKPGAFWPSPKVESAVVRLWPRPAPPVDADPQELLRVARAAFGQRRKTLANALAAAAGAPKAEVEAMLRAVGVDPRRRAETLSLEEFAAIATAWPKPAGTA